MHITFIEGAELTSVAEKNISKNGMCPLEIKYPDLEKMNAISEEEDCLKTKPGQVVTFVSCHCILHVHHYPDPWITTHHRVKGGNLATSEFLCVGQVKGEWRLWRYSTNFPKY